jgi:hypothetical protein
MSFSHEYFIALPLGYESLVATLFLSMITITSLNGIVYSYFFVKV